MNDITGVEMETERGEYYWIENNGQSTLKINNIYAAFHI